MYCIGTLPKNLMGQKLSVVTNLTQASDRQEVLQAVNYATRDADV